MDATITIQRVDRKEGVSKAGKPYVKFSVVDTNGGTYATFDAALANLATSNTGKTAKVSFESGQFGNDLKGLIVTNDEPSGQFVAPPAKTPTGEADWDLIGLRKTRCALWAAFLDGGGRDTNEGRKLVMAAEADIFNREPIRAVDGDIPF